jgi:acyl-coenzyme A thioesterase PaaI-like protein
MALSPTKMKWMMNYWPPLLFNGIRVTHVSADLRHVHVILKLRFYNRNYVGTQYGGAIFSMTDAFLMVMLMNNLGHEYIVWDKAATIQFLKPGRTDLTVEFHLTEDELQKIRALVADKGKIDWIQTVEVKDRDGIVVARVERVIYIKKKP